MKQFKANQRKTAINQLNKDCITHIDLYDKMKELNIVIQCSIIIL